MLTLTVFNIVLVLLSTTEKKEIKDIQNGKEETNLFLFALFYIENHKQSTKTKFSELIGELNQVTEYKINLQEIRCISNTGNKHMDTKNLKIDIASFTISQKD